MLKVILAVVNAGEIIAIGMENFIKRMEGLANAYIARIECGREERINHNTIYIHKIKKFNIDRRPRVKIRNRL